jgi:hypothetical protein
MGQERSPFQSVHDGVTGEEHDLGREESRGGAGLHMLIID